MSNWNTILDKAKDVANMAGKKTGEVVETSKLKLQGFSINNDIQDAYEKMGGLVYRAKKEGVDNNPEIDQCIHEIDELLSALDELESKIAEIKKVKKCPNCTAACSTESHFCSRCGMVIDKQEIVVYPSVEQVEVQSEEAQQVEVQSEEAQQVEVQSEEAASVQESDKEQ